MAVPFAALLYADEFPIPIPSGGDLTVQNPQFIVKNQFNIYDPLLTFGIVDKSSAPWEIVKVHFDMGAVCNGEILQWSESVTVRSSTLLFMKEHGMKNYEYRMNSLTGKVQGCRTELIRVRPGESSVEPLDLRDEVRTLKLKRESEEAVKEGADEAAKTERERVAAEEKAKNLAERGKQEAAEAARRRRLADEKRLKDAEQDALRAKATAAEEAKAAAERRQLQDACVLIYKNTVNKKVGDLTVREEQQVRTCQALDLYPPR